jgi:hypothetical protein
MHRLILAIALAVALVLALAPPSSSAGSVYVAREGDTIVIPTGVTVTIVSGQPASPSPVPSAPPSRTPSAVPLPGPTMSPAPPSRPPCGTLQSRIDAAPAGSVLDLSGCSYSTGATIAKRLTLRGARIVAPADSFGLRVTADDVTLEAITIEGAQATAYDAAEKCLSAPGTATGPIERLTIRSSTIRRCGYGGIHLRYVTDAIVEDNLIEDAVYAGIMLASVSHSVIEANTVRRVGLVGSGANSNNAYGIVATQESGGAHSSDVLIRDNLVESIPTWHGLDTHGGIRIRFEDNTVRAVRRAAFLTGGPVDVVFSGNTLVGPSAAQQAACPADAPAAYCADIRAITLVSADGAIVTDNTGSGWGGRWFLDYGGDSTGVVLSGNSVT